MRSRLVMSQRKDPCQKEACAIQKCLQLNHYRESNCAQEIQAMRICCSKLTTPQSICCSGFHDQPVAKGNLQGLSSVESNKTAFTKS
ncbi:cx9C motif-containing protein 4 [Bufo bufo]|uniref:cx9C motif-containing protein 4 n=1 Tax=Bufo bufo TaxID=8384 RepID=UPI001ABE3DC7|nr:cx9C motif-containing protein 4 [Bufo bufo]